MSFTSSFSKVMYFISAAIIIIGCYAVKETQSPCFVCTQDTCDIWSSPDCMLLRSNILQGQGYIFGDTFDGEYDNATITEGWRPNTGNYSDDYPPAIFSVISFALTEDSVVYKTSYGFLYFADMGDSYQEFLDFHVTKYNTTFGCIPGFNNWYDEAIGGVGVHSYQDYLIEIDRLDSLHPTVSVIARSF